MRSRKGICEISGYEDDVVVADFVGERSIAVASGASICIYDQRYVGTVHNAQSSRTVYVSRGDGGESEIQAISTRGDFVAFVDEDGALGVFDITDPEAFAGKSARFSGNRHDAMAACVCFHPEEPVIATGAFDLQVRVWDIASEKVIRKSTAGLTVESAQQNAGADSQGANEMVNPPFVYALDFVPGFIDTDGASGEDCEKWMPEILATVGLDRTIKLWNSDRIISLDNADIVAAARKDSLPLLAHADLAAKPDTLATAEEAPVIYTDENSSIVAFTAM
ncbi:hypothetical protein EV179_002350 [Coemansia sp. RSA 487]|nr:hypothetical protein EV179_002350 [Coemansia sp. RSA 487]